MQTCPGFFKKSLLEYPGNLLEICSVKSVDTLVLQKLMQRKVQLFAQIYEMSDKVVVLGIDSWIEIAKVG